jgi:5-methylcytosine-specific restriction endonuclease McrBC regulatory subunit McrC
MRRTSTTAERKPAGQTLCRVPAQHKLIEESLRKHLQAVDSAIQVIGQENEHLDTEKLLRIRPDVVIRRGASDIFVLDAKYVLAGDRATNVDHHIQVLAYAIRHGVKDVALVYARDPASETKAANLAVTICNAEVRIHSWSLDLRQGPDQLDTNLTRIAERILRTTGLSTTTS